MPRTLDLNAFAAQDRLMVLSVHPDDETLGAGGLLQRAAAAGAAIRVVFVTSGDNNPWPQRLLERRWHVGPEDRARWGQKRELEALSALDTLGLDAGDAAFLGLPDQGVTQLLTGETAATVQRFAAEIEAWRPTHLVVPAPQDVHPDHNAVAVLAALALDALPRSQPRPQVLAYLIHGNAGPARAPFSLCLSGQELVNKREAILRHRTQVAFGRRRFLAYARAQEDFRELPAGLAFDVDHPVAQLDQAGGEVWVRVRLGGLLRRFGKPVLQLLASGQGGIASARIALERPAARHATSADGSAHEVAVIDAHGKNIAQARVLREDGMDMVQLPAALFAGAERLHLKLSRRWGFFDAAGWRCARLHPPPARQRAATIGLIPCYNVVDFCEPVIRQAMRFVDHLLVIDDGSTDGTSELLARLAMRMPERLSVISFDMNHGKGVGLMAGFCAALNRFDFDTLVTLDGDGQHPPQEIPRIRAAVEAGADLAIGGRDLERMPARSKLGNTTVGSLLRWRYPHAPADTQSGLRGFNRPFIEEIVRKARGSRYETELQVLLLALSQQRNIASVPIPTIYIDNNRSSKFRPVTDSLRILFALLGWELNHPHRFKP